MNSTNENQQPGFAEGEDNQKRRKKMQGVSDYDFSNYKLPLERRNLENN